jgi:hypothetical protein
MFLSLISRFGSGDDLSQGWGPKEHLNPSVVPEPEIQGGSNHKRAALQNCSAMSPGTSTIVVPTIVGPNEDILHSRQTPHSSPQASSRTLVLKTPLTPPKTPKRKFTRAPVVIIEKENFADVVSRNFAKSTFDTQERSYLPETCIKGHPSNTTVSGLITLASVEQEFKRASTYEGYKLQGLDEVISWIVLAARRVFATTVQCHLNPENLVISMLDFYEADFDDTFLPIQDPRAPDAFSDRPPRTAAFLSEIWTEQRHDEFFSLQWSCLAPVFVPDEYEYDLQSQCILPFIKVPEVVARGGSFSSVFKVTVHQDHQRRHASPEVSMYHIKS